MVWFNLFCCFSSCFCSGHYHLQLSWVGCYFQYKFLFLLYACYIWVLRDIFNILIQQLNCILAFAHSISVLLMQLSIHSNLGLSVAQHSRKTWLGNIPFHVLYSCPSNLIFLTPSKFTCRMRVIIHISQSCTWHFFKAL